MIYVNIISLIISLAITLSLIVAHTNKRNRIVINARLGINILRMVFRYKDNHLKQTQSHYPAKKHIIFYILLMSR